MGFDLRCKAGESILIRYVQSPRPAAPTRASRC